jgi:uncharacterized paraquat-inducible protein A
MPRLSPPDTHECPACALDVPAGEAECPYCGYEFVPERRVSAWAALAFALLMLLPLYFALRALF